MDRQTQLENARRAIFSSYSEDHSAPTASSSSPCIPTKSSKLTGADEEALTTSNPSGTNKRAFNRRASKKQRSRSLVRHTNPAEGSSSANSPRKAASSSLLWSCTVFLTTLLIPNCILKRCLGTKDLRVCQSWREKFTLCWIIFILCCALAFMTFGLSTLVCDNSNNYRTLSFFKKANQEGKEKWFLIHGKIFSPFSPQSSGLSAMAKAKVEDFVGHDVSDLFTRAPACEEIGIPYPFVCRVPGVPSLRECIEPGLLNGIHVVGNVALEWKDVDNSRSRFVYNGKVYDLAKYLSEFPSPSDPNKPFSDHVDRILRTSIGRDATKAMSALPHTTKACLGDLFLVGNLDVKSMGCIMTDIILWISLLIILSVIFIRFMLAGFYSWFISRRLGRLHLRDGEEIRFKRSRTPSSFSTKYSKAKDRTANSLGAPETMVSNHLMNVILLVTCYSEGEASIRTTIDSLASTDYPDEHKLLFIIADGMIKGAGNEKTTPEIILDMIEFANEEDISPLPQYSLALSEGSKRLNMAKVYSGRYRTLDGVHWVPALVVVKCGTPLEEAAGTDKKPGNRGKRDSQIILMSWLSKSLFNDRMTPLEYEIHRKVRNCFSLDPAAFEAVLMVDADTFVLPASLSKMIAVLEDDPMIMGMCGETQISNKGASWVTAIQVFEYYISHHLSKAFESVFGGVTCLPGCFCMYRIKAKREDGWVPLLANPDIIDQYSENVTDTLHKKNLLLLGEDRYLTTLMLKTFPCRKLIFLAAAKCRTFVPDRFSILLSQRRRWINSTVHNLCELVLVRDLCGTLCCSMQFVVFMELVGSLVLPAAIIFTVVLIVTAFLGDPQWIPLFLLLAILGLPAVLILFTTRELGYILWMLIYLISLPIWNFVLPVYAFWHFDDFSWGETRRLDAESGKSTNAAGGHGAAEGDFDWKMITMKRWQEYDEELWE